MVNVRVPETGERLMMQPQGTKLSRRSAGWTDKRLLPARLLVLAAAMVVVFAPVAFAESVTAQIDLSDQEMRVSVDEQEVYVWPVSTARGGYCTPVGRYKPVRLERVWYSTIYNNAPMPYSIFFHRGYAIHGTTDLANLGRPASHGCVRLHPDNAKILFELVQKNGKAATDIVITP